MNVHTELVKIFIQLGYSYIEGICHGISVKWLEACILKEEHLFNTRIASILAYNSSIPSVIGHGFFNDRRCDLAKKNKPSIMDGSLLDTLSFFDSLSLFHMPHVYDSLFKKSFSQCDINMISPIASSDKMIALGGLISITYTTGIYTVAEIKDSLDSLGSMLERIYISSPQPIGLLLSSEDHVIAISFTPQGGWSFMDINQYPSKNFNKEDTYKLAELIAKGFCRAYSKYQAFNIRLLTTSNDSNLSELQLNLRKLNKHLERTAERALQCERNISIAHISAKIGDVDTISELAKHGVNLNTRDVNGQTPAYIAAQNGHIGVIAELAKHGARLNKASVNGLTPAFIAAQQGHVGVIAELAKHGARLNKTDGTGSTPAFIAAQQGHAAVIAELAKHGARLNKASVNGVTPALIAAQAGHVNVIAELAKHGARLNKMDSSGVTPAFIAAQNGHVAFIAELAKHGARLNKGDLDRRTPAFMAAKNGHAAVIAELAKHGARLNKASVNGATPALIAAQNGHVDVIAELAKHGVDLNIANVNGVTPMCMSKSAESPRRTPS